MKTNNHTTRQQLIFYALAAIFFTSLIAFVVMNFVFLTANLNKAFGYTPQANPQTVRFDGKAFDALELTH